MFQKAVPTQDVTNPVSSFFLLFVGYFFLPWRYITLLHSSHDQSNWSPSFPSNTFQNFQGISDLSSEVPKFQQHTKLCSECSTSLDFFPSLNLSTICWWKEPSSCSILLLPKKSWIEFQMYITCYHATLRGEIFHILLLFIVYHNLYCRMLPSDSYYLNP